MDKKQKIAISVAIVAVLLVVLIIFLMSSKTVYTVSFNSFGGQVVTSQEIEDGKYAQKPAYFPGAALCSTTDPYHPGG